MKKITFFTLLMVVLLSLTIGCSKEVGDPLTDTKWSTAVLTPGGSTSYSFEFSGDEQISCYMSSELQWVGVYKWYKSNVVYIYKAVPGTSDWPLTYTGTIENDAMTLNDGLVLNKN